MMKKKIHKKKKVEHREPAEKEEKSESESEDVPKITGWRQIDKSLTGIPRYPITDAVLRIMPRGTVIYGYSKKTGFMITMHFIRYSTTHKTIHYTLVDVDSAKIFYTVVPAYYKFRFSE